MRSVSRLYSGAIRLALTVVALALGACGGDDAPTGPVNTDLAGDWTYEVSGTGGGGTCDVTDMTLSFVSNGGTLEGTVTGGGSGTIVCSPGGIGNANFSNAPLTDIVQNGEDVEFRFEITSGVYHSSGRLTDGGNSMSGAVTFFVEFTSSGKVEFEGSWTAVRN